MITKLPTAYATTIGGEIIDVYSERAMAEAWVSYMRRREPGRNYLVEVVVIERR